MQCVGARALQNVLLLSPRGQSSRSWVQRPRNNSSCGSGGTKPFSKSVLSGDLERRAHGPSRALANKEYNARTPHLFTVFTLFDGVLPLFVVFMPLTRSTIRLLQVCNSLQLA